MQDFAVYLTKKNVYNKKKSITASEIMCRKGKHMLKKLTKRICILTLIAAMLLPSCSQSNEPAETDPTLKQNTDPAADTETEAETETTRADVDDGLPEANYDGRAFRKNCCYRP